MKPQPPKKGKVIRISKDTEEALMGFRSIGDTWDQCLKVLLTQIRNPYTMWVLPSTLMSSSKEARLQALSEAARENRPFEDAEQPVPVCEVLE